MTARALFVTGTEVMPVANDVPANSPYRGTARLLSPGEMAPAAKEDNAEVLILVERGTIELMVGGARFPLGKTQSARIPAGVVFAYRNNGKTDASVSCAVVPPKTMSNGPSLTVAA